jgi:transposase, IS5 family
MIVDRYEAVNLFELVPKLNLELEPELAQLDRLLEDDVHFERVKVDLARRHPNSKRLGRHSTPVEVILRMLVVKHLYGFTTSRPSTSLTTASFYATFVASTLSPPPTTPP